MKPLHLAVSLLLTILTVDAVIADGGIYTFPQWQTPKSPTWFQPPADVDVVFRAQSGSVPIPPGAAAGSAATGTFDIPSAGGSSVPAGSEPTTWNAFSPPISPDPFAPNSGYGGVAPYAPYSPYGPGAITNPYGNSQPFSTFGANGLEPYRQGWHPKLEVEWLPTSDVSPAGRGEVEQFGVDYDLAHTGPFMPGWILTWTNQFRLRNWDGPGGAVPSAGLPGKAFRFGIDLELETPQAGPVSMSFGVTPSINTDFDASLGGDAFQLDGRGMFIFQLDQAWSMVLGAGYWDRVNDRVIPYAGLVYHNDYWQWRIMYPESEVSVFLGNGPTGASWLYARAEYRVEAYEVRVGTTPPTTTNDEVELEDYRVVLGLRTDTGSSSWFIEGGWVFDRNVEYSNAANVAFEPDTGFITRMGWSY